jgi:ferrous iron transport protein B
MVLASYGPGEKFNAEKLSLKTINNPLPQTEFENAVASQKRKLLYWNHGKAIEPAISPLGYDWKIGIAIISSFAAREVLLEP